VYISKRRIVKLNMGQLDVYAIVDIFILALFGSFLSSYFSVELNGSVEQVAPYKYSDA